ncbi:hypothetical protein AKJ09_07637 [Labilithrix luteola]|uniref:Uncharacterized protein n=1 Tax=Labilithrix luteola TaxID=1391654 RepID=A0A0K1Q5H8_9BACT|nr:hypothetical protein [Labilithrix luteola]AKV00974.1 hypothetical protein AKJ09_07637 [Labilithrix luteola]
MSANVTSPVDVKPSGHPESSLKPRVFALAVLAALLTGIAWLGRGIYYAVVDAWMVPITLSPDNDQVLQINVKLNEQIVQRNKLQADIERIDADLRGIDAAIARLRTIESSGVEAIRWTASATRAQSKAVAERMRGLGEQKRLLAGMLARQKLIADNARRNAEAGLLARQELDREAQVLDQLELAISQNARDMQDSRMQGAQFLATQAVLRDAMNGDSKRGGVGILPEIVAGEERAVRLDLELIRLEAERRSLVSQRGISVEALGRMEEMFRQLKARPLYRAIEAKTDVAFVPYTQLPHVRAGAPVVACTWALFDCRIVGRIAEVLPGEVVAQDPWSNVERGQYAILDLNDREAAKEKVLRARSMR